MSRSLSMFPVPGRRRMLPAHFAPVHPGLMKNAAPATMQGREVPAAAGACLGWGGGGTGRGEEGPVGHQQSMPHAPKSGLFAIARDVSDTSPPLSDRSFNIVWPGPSQQHLAQRSWVLNN